ncbi:hypothetical protein OAJ42_00520 [Flavobacteriales bacterium]|nr:hypothetical protein [Flavobacteriales bacterium]MDC0189349.1 hypothetical protein [Flavobacteriales bacterium]
MKKLVLLFIPLVFFFGCDPDDESENTSYNCVNDECFSADGGSGQYNTLADCLIVCGNENISYNCIDNECFSADEGSGQYATLDDCLSVCGNINYNCSTEGCVESEDGQYATIQECEGVCSCNCGIVTYILTTPPSNGEPDPYGGFTGAHTGYSITYMENLCTGNQMSTCSLLSIGDIVCGNTTEEYRIACEFADDVPCFDSELQLITALDVLLESEWYPNGGGNLPLTFYNLNNELYQGGCAEWN